MDEQRQHTPGPWRAVVDIAAHPQWFRVEAADGNICAPRYGREPSGIDAANARLIAAAPDLLAALKFVANITRFATNQYYEIPAGEWCDVIGKVEAAIAKADQG